MTNGERKETAMERVAMTPERTDRQVAVAKKQIARARAGKRSSVTVRFDPSVVKPGRTVEEMRYELRAEAWGSKKVLS